MERTVNALPWAAAISFAAGVSSTVIALIVSKDFIDIYFQESRGLSPFRWMFPTAFAANALFWLPVALWARADRRWAAIGTILAGVVAVLLLTQPFAPRSYHQPGVGVIKIFNFVLNVIPLSLCVALCSLPTGAMVLVLSGERKAIAKGTWISELPYPYLRVGLLLLLTFLPLVAYALL